MAPHNFDRHPVQIDQFKRDTKGDHRLQVHGIVGSFTRSPDFNFEVYLVNRPSDRTYGATTFIEFYIKHEDCIQWSWGGDCWDKDPDHEFTRELLNDLLADLPRQLGVLFPPKPPPYTYPASYELLLPLTTMPAGTSA